VTMNVYSEVSSADTREALKRLGAAFEVSQPGQNSLRPALARILHRSAVLSGDLAGASSRF
jgi:hypothetical protein